MIRLTAMMRLNIRYYNELDTANNQNSNLRKCKLKQCKLK